MQRCLEPLRQHCTRFLPFQSCSWLTDSFYKENNLCNVVLTTVGKHCTAILSSHCCLNTSKTMCNVDQGRTNMFLQEKKALQCYLDLPEPTLHKEFTFAMLAHSSPEVIRKMDRKIIYNFVWIYLGQH